MLESWRRVPAAPPWASLTTTALVPSNTKLTVPNPSAKGGPPPLPLALPGGPVGHATPGRTSLPQAAGQTARRPRPPPPGRPRAQASLTSAGRPPTVSVMSRLLLALWFAVTALLGPGVCCCSFASSLATHTALRGEPAPEPVKSCCRQEAPPSGDRTPEPGAPTKCPCEQTKHAIALPPGGHADADLAAQLKLRDALFVGPLFDLTSDLNAASSASADSSRPAARPAGRDLLAAYSRLRC